MCGIIGYIGNKKTTDVLLNGLYALEYRGYDSAGIAVSDGEHLDIIKSVGRVCELENKIKDDKIDGFYGIAHTRWATNGEANLVNAHPHNHGVVTLVHNGIIENADELRNNLKDNGYSFFGETDSEVVCALIDYNLKNNHVLEAINKTINMLVGSYAFGIMIEGENKLYATRKDSPLLIGIGDNENFLASDISAIIKYTNRYILLEVGDIAVLDESSYKIYNNSKEIEREVLVTESKDIVNSKNGYDHYMLKEIMEEPIVLKNLIERFKSKEARKELDLSMYDEICIVACGSAMYAGLIGQSLIEEYANIKVSVYSASEYRYKKKIFNGKTAVILISQSGETADTIAAMRESKKLGVFTFGIVNNQTSTIARECDKCILINAGVEIAVATTKAYILQVCVLALIAYTIGEKKDLKNIISYDDFESLPSKLKQVLDRNEEYKLIADKLYKHDYCFFIGRGIDYAICMEGSLKLKEVTYIHSEAYQAGELKHGTISLIEKGTPVITIITDDRLKDKTLSNLRETEARGADGIIISNCEIEDYKKVLVPDCSVFLSSMLVVPVLQMISYFVGINKGCDIDKPRNLAKSVTVE